MRVPASEVARMLARQAGPLVSTSANLAGEPPCLTVELALRAFPAIIVGGLTSPVGAVIAGFLLGLAEVLAQRYLEPALGDIGRNFHTVFPYVVMIAFLMVRPYGLFGTRDVERV